MEFSFWNCSGFSYGFVCWESATICFEGKATFPYFSFLLIFFSCLDWRPVPASPLIPPEPTEQNPDPFSFLCAAMDLLSFSFQDILNKKHKIFTRGRNFKRNQILSSIPPENDSKQGVKFSSAESRTRCNSNRISDSSGAPTLLLHGGSMWGSFQNRSGRPGDCSHKYLCHDKNYSLEVLWKENKALMLLLK